MPVRRDYLLVTALAAFVGLILMFSLSEPAYTDAYYYFNAGQRWATGQGLTDAGIWTYLGNPPRLPAPSHLYWMPLASIVQGVSMMVFGATFRAAQLPMLLCYIGLVVIGFWLGARLHNSRRGAWLSAILTLFSGYFMSRWLLTDSFALYGIVGAGALVCMGLANLTPSIPLSVNREGKAKRAIRPSPFAGRGRGWGSFWYILAGLLSGLAHLTRADGVLLVIVLIIIALLPPRRNIKGALFGLIAYLLVMLPWFARNLAEVGAILSVGGFQTAWMVDYAETVNYPPIISLQNFLNQGIGFIIQSRVDAVFGANGAIANLIAVEGMIVVAPLMLIGLWRRRADPFLRAFILYALGLHAAMSLVFALPGMRGGLFHSAAALVPFWAALGVCGLDDVIRWIAKRRRWKVQGALRFFGLALALIVIIFTVVLAIPTIRRLNVPNARYIEIGAVLPPNAVVIINDPPAFYYYTGKPGIVVPNAPPDMIPELGAKYSATHLILDENRTEPMNDLYTGKTVLPPFLKLVTRTDAYQIYEVIR